MSKDFRVIGMRSVTAGPDTVSSPQPLSGSLGSSSSLHDMSILSFWTWQNGLNYNYEMPGRAELLTELRMIRLERIWKCSTWVTGFSPWGGQCLSAPLPPFHLCDPQGFDACILVWSIPSMCQAPCASARGEISINLQYLMWWKDSEDVPVSHAPNKSFWKCFFSVDLQKSGF